MWYTCCMGNITIEMSLSKTTKGTYVYAAFDSAVPTISVKRSAFDANPPQKIVLTIAAA